MDTVTEIAPKKTTLSKIAGLNKGWVFTGGIIAGALMMAGCIALVPGDKSPSLASNADIRIITKANIVDNPNFAEDTMLVLKESGLASVCERPTKEELYLLDNPADLTCYTP